MSGPMAAKRATKAEKAAAADLIRDYLDEVRGGAPLPDAIEKALGVLEGASARRPLNEKEKVVKLANAIDAAATAYRGGDRSAAVESVRSAIFAGFGAVESREKVDEWLSNHVALKARARPQAGRWSTSMVVTAILEDCLIASNPGSIQRYLATRPARRRP